jgi:hypothetical protein
MDKVTPFLSDGELLIDPRHIAPPKRKRLKKIKRTLIFLEQNRRVVKIRKIDPQSEEGEAMSGFNYPMIVELTPHDYTGDIPFRLRRMDVVNLIHDLADSLR